MIGHLILTIRRACNKEHVTRWRERIAVPGLPRPDGKILWIHAASVGEVQTALTLLPFLNTLRQTSPFTLLITTGTVTSAALVAPRMPEWAIHQFYPIDTPALTSRFLDYWQPSAALWMESEIWPFMLHGLKKRAVPVMLINARLSPRSTRRWGILPSLARFIMRAFTLVLAQNEAAATAFRRFISGPVIASGNLKYSAPPLPVNAMDLDALHHAMQGRPVIVYASTHEGEETMAASIHIALRHIIPGLLTIIAPRHPQRADSILASLPKDLTIMRRIAAKDPPTATTDIYLADTIGELGLFYQLADIAFIGRSLSHDGGGGHNPLEAAHFGCAILTGPHTQNLAEIYKDMEDAQAVICLSDAASLQSCAQALLQDQALLHQAQKRSHTYIQGQMAVLDQVADTIHPIIRQAMS